MANLIIHNYGKIPEGYDAYCTDISELDEWDIEKLQGLGVDEIWYWYAVGSYEGDGEILMRKGTRFRIHDAGHCSCFGPTDYATFGDHEGFDTLAELEATLSDDYGVEIKPLIAMAIKQGYK